MADMRKGRELGPASIIPVKTYEKRRLILLLCVLLAGGFVATSLASYFVSKSLMREALVSRELPLTSDNIYSEIQRDLLRPIFISSLMAQDTFLRDWALAGEKGDDAVTHYLDEIMKKYGMFTTFFISEKTRVYYHASGILKKVREDEPRDLWYWRVRKMSQDYELNVDPDMAHRDTMTIFINYRVLDYQGNFIGITGVGLAVDSVRGIIENYQQRYQRNVFFINKDGDVVIKAAGVYDNFKKLEQIPGYGPLTREILSADHGSFHYRRDGDTVQVNSRYIPELNWRLIVEQSEDPSLATLRQTLWLNLGVCLVVSIVILVAASLTVNYYQGRLEILATTDKLSGLYNRRAFEVLFEQSLKENERLPMTLSVILFDVDYFKSINDTYGHATGDRAIAELAKILLANIRASDIACRWGGEEFLALARDCDTKRAFELAEKLRHVVETSPMDINGETIRMTVSLGVAEHAHGESMDQLLHRADQAMYAAKEAGRNRTIIG